MNKYLMAALVGGVLHMPWAASAAPVPPAHGSASSPSTAALRQDMRRLWTEHVIWTRDYIVAAVADQPDQQAAATRLMKNQDDIGAAHLATTTDEVVARLTKNWDQDVRAFDAVYDHILHMADALSDGIIAQFPTRFESTPTTSGR